MSHIPSPLGQYNDIAREGSSLIYPLICRLMYQKHQFFTYVVYLISFTSGIVYFTFQLSFKSFISGLILVLNCCYS